MKKNISKLRRVSLIALSILLILTSAALPAASAATSRVDEIMANMTLRQKITQMMMVDFRKWDSDLSDGEDPADFEVMNDQVAKIIEDYDFGGIILFANNVKETEQTLNLTKAMQEAATKDGGIPLLIGTDQEGGSVYRLGSGTALPGNMALGATGNPANAKKAGEIIGSELSALGINTNFAPVVDVNSNANNPVIGLRSFSDDPELVSQMGVAMIEGMNEYGVASASKHFPGHGDTATDSHTGLPVVNKSLDELKSNELIPFEAAMDAGVDLIMTAHILYPQVDDTKVMSDKTGIEEPLPATLSHKILTDLVRGELNYQGVIITDAMNMAGVSDMYDQVQATKLAIQAGVDIVLMPCVLYNNTDDLKDLDAIIDGVEKAVENGEITEERINESVKRILTLKENRGILDYDGSALTLEKAEAVVGGTENRDAERKISAEAVTVVKNENNVLPLKVSSTDKVLLLCPYDNEKPGLLIGWNRAKAAGLIPDGAEVKAVRYKSDSTMETLQSDLDWATIVIMNSEVSSAAAMASTHWLTKIPTEVTDYCAANDKTSIVLSVDKPYDVQHYANADAVLAVYGCKGSSSDPTEIMGGFVTAEDAASGPNITAGVEVAFGIFGASGTLPVNVPQFDEASGAYTDTIVYERGFGIKYDSVIVDKSELQAKVEEMEKVTSDGYTTESWVSFQNALNDAKDVLSDDNATQAAITEALTNLNDAYAALKQTGSTDNTSETQNTDSTTNTDSTKPTGSTSSTDSTSSTTKPSGGAPSTGQTSYTMVWVVIILVAAAVIVGSVIYNKRKSNK